MRIAEHAPSLASLDGMWYVSSLIGVLLNSIGLVSVGAGFSRRGRTKFGFLERRPRGRRAG
jgi:hypothetical protein